MEPYVSRDELLAENAALRAENGVLQAQMGALQAQQARLEAQVHELEARLALAFTTVLGMLLKGGRADGAMASSRGGPVPAMPPSIDMPIAEYLAQRRVDSHPDRVVAIAYYHYRRFDGQGVTTRDLVEAYTKARAKRPQNYPDVIASCVRKGYLVLVDGGRRDGMKTWVVTRTGEAHVEQEL
jgi:hypothetical protein